MHFKRTPIGTNQWQTTEYLYDPVGNLQTLSQPSGARRVYEYDAANRLRLEHLYSDATTELRNYRYEYDPNHNRTDIYETRYNPSASYHTHYTYTDRDQVETITDGYGSTTTYHYDELGAVAWLTDPAGIRTVVTPRTTSTDETIEHYLASDNTLLATTTNHYDGSNRLDGWTTVDPINTLTLTTGMPFNAAGYVEQANVSHEKVGGLSGALTSTVQYKDNHLLGTWTQQYQNNHAFEYDSAQQLRCSELPGGNACDIIFYNASGQREDEYMYGGGEHPCANLVNQPKSHFDSLGNWVDHAHFTYDGHRLTARSQTSLLFAFAETYNYDADGNVQQVTKVEGNNTIQLTYNWEPGTHQLTSFTHTTNGSNNYSATFEYDRLNRIRKFCWNGNNCHLFSYVGDSDWLSVVRDQYGNLKQRYLYANGRPLRVDVMDAAGQPANYFRYNARGDAAGFVDKEGGGGTGWTMFGAWGAVQYGSTGYYSWNAAWGYLTFPNSLWAAPGDVLDGIYYAHGRWWRADIGIFLSPSENSGEYQYGSGQDAVNEAWDAISNFGAGAICQFVNDETLSATGGLNNLIQSLDIC